VRGAVFQACTSETPAVSLIMSEVGTSIHDGHAIIIQIRREDQKGAWCCV